MPVIAIVNRKGGSGKSTLATHLAAYCAHNGISVMLGDVDRQQSTQAWLRLRTEATGCPPIMGWALSPQSVLRSPPGVSHVVLDTPGGLRGFELARVAMFADVILMPVCNSVFDRESAADCYAELKKLPRIASGRCQVAAVGMRLNAETKSGELLKEWADRHKLPFVGALRDTQAYVRCIERGLTLFDLPDAETHADLAQWQPILQWLGPVLHPKPRDTKFDRRATPAALHSPAGSRVDNLKPAQSSLAHSRDLAPQRRYAPPALAKASQRPTMVNRVGSLLGSLTVVPRFLQR